MHDNFRNLRDEILSIYHLEPNVANDDKLLIARVWDRHGWTNDRSLYDNLKTVPSAESIRRTRQKLVAEGLIKPSEKATEKRYVAFRGYRKEFYEF